MTRAERITKRLRDAWAANACNANVNYLALQNRRSALRSVMRSEDEHCHDFDEVLAVARSEAAYIEVGGELVIQHELPEAKPDMVVMTYDDHVVEWDDSDDVTSNAHTPYNRVEDFDLGGEA